MSIQSTTQKTPIVDMKLDATTIKKLWAVTFKVGRMFSALRQVKSTWQFAFSSSRITFYLYCVQHSVISKKQINLLFIKCSFSPGPPEFTEELHMRQETEGVLLESFLIYEPEHEATWFKEGKALLGALDYEERYQVRRNSVYLELNIQRQFSLISSR
jgi:hypothetical protein